MLYLLTVLPCVVSVDNVNTLSVDCCWKCYLVLCLLMLLEVLPCAVSVDCCWKCYLVLCLMTMLTHCLLAAVGSVTLCCV